MNKKTLMEELARKAYEKGAFNGTWLYAENGEMISKGAFGFRDADDKLPMEEDTIFEMASVTKIFTATAIMLLAREGKLSLDDEYAEYFPDYPYAGVKIRHLLTHTSGMPDDFETENWVCPAWEKENRIPSCSEIISFINKSDEKASHTPGETFRYTDIGYCLLANLVEKLSGTSFEDYLKKNIFEPAGMKDSAIYHTRRDGRPSDRFARNMVLEDNEEDNEYIPSDLSEAAPYVVGSDGLNGCDYLYTTIFDMLAWDRALREEKVLTREEQKLMFTPGKLNNGKDIGYDDDEGTSYGLGWGIENDDEHGLVVMHSGGMPGLETWFERFVDEDKMLVILNCRDYQDIRAAERFWDGMREIIRGEEPEPVVSIEDIMIKDPDRSEWESYCGKYEHPEDAEFVVEEVFMKDKDLWATAVDEDGDSLTFRLYPTGEKEFGRKRGMLKLNFCEDCIMYDDLTCKKL
ncbi:MAG: beta-lactamase family protein [Erysipelotrichaceae bacterium]|nr:beta-lactamase family protein [Erysipelotrichaceae bacterium]